MVYSVQILKKRLSFALKSKIILASYKFKLNIDDILSGTFCLMMGIKYMKFNTKQIKIKNTVALSFALLLSFLIVNSVFGESISLKTYIYQEYYDLLPVQPVSIQEECHNRVVCIVMPCHSLYV